MTLVHQMRRAATPVVQRIASSNFFVEQLYGTLPSDVFMKFLRPDVHYFLPLHSRALQQVHRRLQSTAFVDHTPMQSHDSNSKYIDVLYNLYPELRAKTQGTFFRQDSVQMNIFVKYAKHCIDHAQRSPRPVAIAASLACLQLYVELGECIPRKLSKDNPYFGWLQTFTNARFVTNTTGIMTILDHETEHLPIDSEEAHAVIDAYLTSMQYELELVESLGLEEQPEAEAGAEAANDDSPDSTQAVAGCKA